MYQIAPFFKNPIGCVIPFDGKKSEGKQTWGAPSNQKHSLKLVDLKQW
jgi:hypothetical protein